jgi:hypothetical protein
VDINISVAVDAGCRLSNTAIYGQKAKYCKLGETSLGLAQTIAGLYSQSFFNSGRMI